VICPWGLVTVPGLSGFPAFPLQRLVGAKGTVIFDHPPNRWTGMP